LVEDEKMSEEIKIEDMVGVIGAYCIFASYYASLNDKEKMTYTHIINDGVS